LIQTAFFQNIRKLDTAKLFVGRHAKPLAIEPHQKNLPVTIDVMGS